MADKKPVKVKKTIWIPVIATGHFQDAFLGEIPTTEAGLLVGRKISVNVGSLVNDMKKQNYTLKFSIKESTEQEAKASAFGFYTAPASTRRIIRRGRKRINPSFSCATKDGKVARVKPILVPLNRTISSVTTAVLKQTQTFLTAFFASNSFEDSLMAIVDGKIIRDLKDYLKKIYPIKSVEFSMVHLEEGKKPEDIGVVIQESKAEPENKEKAESKEDEAEAPGGQESAPAEEPEYEAGSDVVVEEESIGSQSPNSE